MARYCNKFSCQPLQQPLIFHLLPTSVHSQKTANSPTENYQFHYTTIVEKTSSCQTTQHHQQMSSDFTHELLDDPAFGAVHFIFCLSGKSG